MGTIKKTIVPALPRRHTLSLAHVGASLLAINPLEVNKKSEYSLKLNIFFAQ